MKVQGIIVWLYTLVKFGGSVQTKIIGGADSALGQFPYQVKVLEFHG